MNQISVEEKKEERLINLKRSYLKRVQHAKKLVGVYETDILNEKEDNLYLLD